MGQEKYQFASKVAAVLAARENGKKPAIESGLTYQ
jgi:hypothetical protein